MLDVDARLFMIELYYDLVIDCTDVQLTPFLQHNSVLSRRIHLDTHKQLPILLLLRHPMKPRQDISTAIQHLPQSPSFSLIYAHVCEGSMLLVWRAQVPCVHASDKECCSHFLHARCVYTCVHTVHAQTYGGAVCAAHFHLSTPQSVVSNKVSVLAAISQTYIQARLALPETADSHRLRIVAGRW